MLLKLSSCLFFIGIFKFSQSQECSDQSKLVIAASGNYVLSYLKPNSKIIETSLPEELLYDRGDVFYRLDNLTFALFQNSDKPTVIRYSVKMKGPNTYVDGAGNKIVKKDNTLQLTKFGPLRKLKILTNYGPNIGDFVVDSDKDRAFFIGYDLQSSNKEVGRMFAFDTGDLDEIGSKVFVNEVDVGNDIIKISIDQSNGNILLAKKISSKSWSLFEMKPVNLEVCKTPRRQGINKDALISSIQIASEQIISLYENAVLGKDDSPIIRQRQNVAYPSGGPTKPISSDTPAAPVPSMAGTDINVCGQTFADMSTKIEDLTNKLNVVKQELNNLHTKVFLSEPFKKLKDYQAKSPLTTVAEVKCNLESTQVCFVKKDYDIYRQQVEEVKSVLNSTHEWLSFVYDTSGDVGVSSRFIDIDLRFADVNESK